MLARGRNLPFYAGTAAAYGMDREEALKMITSNTAMALGIEERVGTLEIGKDAHSALKELSKNRILTAETFEKERSIGAKALMAAFAALNILYADD